MINNELNVQGKKNKTPQNTLSYVSGNNLAEEASSGTVQTTKPPSRGLPKAYLTGQRSTRPVRTPGKTTVQPPTISSAINTLATSSTISYITRFSSSWYTGRSTAYNL